MKQQNDLHRMAHEESDEQVLNSMDSESTNPIPVIYQSGYLTIKGYDEEFGIYRLGFPNREVEEGFIRFLLPYYANVNKVESPFEIHKFVREVRAGDYVSFFSRFFFFFFVFFAVCKVSFRIFLMGGHANWNYIIRMYYISCVNW